MLLCSWSLTIKYCNICYSYNIILLVPLSRYLTLLCFSTLITILIMYIFVYIHASILSLHVSYACVCVFPFITFLMISFPWTYTVTCNWPPHSHLKELSVAPRIIIFFIIILNSYKILTFSLVISLFFPELLYFLSLYYVFQFIAGLVLL